MGILEELAATNARMAALAKEPVYPTGGREAAIGTQFQRRPGAPAARKGEDAMSSRPFRFLNLFGAMSGALQPEESKIELECCQTFQKAMRDYKWHPQHPGASFSVPLGSSFLPDEFRYSSEMQNIKSVMAAGAPTDLDEIRDTAKHVYGPAVAKGYNPLGIKATQSAITETLGGSLVAPPEFGEVIELLRNQEALVNAGARTIQLPAQGSVVFPRVTSPSSANTFSEGQAGTTSTVGTGHLTLAAKKIMSMIIVPNELFRFATAAAEAILRNDMTKTLALQADLYFLEGNGANNTPKGIIGYNGTNEVVQYQSISPAPLGIGGNGNTVRPEDGYSMAALVEENNAMLEGWIMRPGVWANVGGFRADAVTAGDAAGVFVQNLFRAMGDNLDPAWCGFPITKTNQVSRSRQKGTSTNLSYIIGGMWSDFLIGLFGAIEFLASNTGAVLDGATQVNALGQDLTIIRGIMLGDAGPRHSGAFCIYDQIVRQ